MGRPVLRKRLTSQERIAIRTLANRVRQDADVLGDQLDPDRRVFESRTQSERMHVCGKLMALQKIATELFYYVEVIE